MPRLTRAQRVQQENEMQALEFFEVALAKLPDARRAQGKRYPLRSVIVIALMAMVCGADDATAMEAWGKANEAWLVGFLDLPHGAPTQDVFLGVFGACDPVAFSAVFYSGSFWHYLMRDQDCIIDLRVALNASDAPEMCHLIGKPVMTFNYVDLYFVCQQHKAIIISMTAQTHTVVIEDCFLEIICISHECFI